MSLDTTSPLSEINISDGSPGPSGNNTATTNTLPESNKDRRTRFLEAAKNGRDDEVQALLTDGQAIDSVDLGRALREASAGGHVATVGALLGVGVRVDGRETCGGRVHRGYEHEVWSNSDCLQGVCGRTALQAAAEGGHAEIVSILLEAGANVEAPPSEWHGRTALQAASGGGHAEIVSILLEAGANVEAPPSEYYGRTALQAASGGGHAEIVSILLEAGANVEAPPSEYYGRTALQAASGGGHAEIVSILLEAGANVEAPPSEYYGRTALQAAAEGGHAEIVSILLEAGANVEAPPSEDSGRTALQAAAEGGHAEIVSILLEAGAKVEEPLSWWDGRTALQGAAEGGHAEIVSILLEAGANVEAPPSRAHGRTALQAASGGGHAEIVSILLVAGAKVEAPPSEYHGRTALQAASGGGHAEIVSVLLKAGAKVDAPPPEYGRTALQAALGGGHAGVVSVLLKAGAMIGTTELQAAASGGHAGVVSVLLKAGAMIGTTELQAAAKGGHAGVVSILLKAGVGPEATAIQVAAESGHLAVVEILLDAGVNINTLDSRGRTFLTWGISHSYIVRVLLKRGAVIHQRALDGATPLHSAVRGQHAESAVLLLKSGADVESTDYENQKPLDIALLGSEPSPRSISLVKLLLEHGCDIGRREIDGWRRVLRADNADLVVMTETRSLVTLPHTDSEIAGGEGGNDSGEAKVYGRPSIGISLVRVSPELPDFNTDGSEAPIIRRLCSGLGTKILFPVTDDNLIGSVVEWKWLKLDGELRPAGRGLSTVGELVTAIDKQAFLSCYVCFEFLTVPDIKQNTSGTSGNAFQTDTQKCEISWTMRKPCVGLDAQSDPGKGVGEDSKPIFRSEDFRSTLNIGWIPENGVDFFTLFIIDLHKKWRVLLEQADIHLSRNRQILLLKKGKTTQFIDNLLFDAQQWSNFRALLQIHVRKARDLQQDFEEKRYLCAELDINLKDGEKNQRNRKGRKRSAAGLAIEKLSKGIARMEFEVESEIKKLDEKTKDMIELEFNLVSIYEARTSKIMGMSMKRLSWITFIFLPLMFVASLFGMNIDLITSGPHWWWVIVLGVVVFVLVILGWSLLKIIRFEEGAEIEGGGTIAGKLEAYSGVLRRGWRRRRGPADLESGKPKNEFKPPRRQWTKLKDL